LELGVWRDCTETFYVKIMCGTPCIQFAHEVLAKSHQMVRRN
jgi:hypothetical protein